MSDRNEEGENLYRTTQIGRELIGNKGYSYSYDKMGNITQIIEGARKAEGETTLTSGQIKVTYVYDDQNQLIRENNKYLGDTIVYSYDKGGNLTEKKVYDYTVNDDLSALEYTSIPYGYDSTWKDKLVSYNGQEITYDEIGNPLSYLGNTMTWTGGNLRKVVTDDATIKYVYNASGVRTKKTVGSEESNYYYSNGQLAYEKRGNKELYYSYDQDGTIAAICYVKEDGTAATYYPAVNSRGDVEALYNYKGELVAEYCYDSWGKVISIKNASGNEITSEAHIGLVNPIRYRGYYYDAETGFYYLNSRYYDPEIGRFLNADSVIDNRGVNTLNLFAYCGNNPVNNADPTGHAFGAIIGGLVGGILGGLTAAASGKSIAAGILTGALIGAIIGGICDGSAAVVAAAAGAMAKGVAIVKTMVACATVAAGGNVLNQVINYHNESKQYNTNNPKQNNVNKSKNSVSNKKETEYVSLKNYIDIESVINSAISAAICAPLAVGGGIIVDGVLGTGVSGLTKLSKFIAESAMGSNVSMIQTSFEYIIPIFED